MSQSHLNQDVLRFVTGNSERELCKALPALSRLAFSPAGGGLWSLDRLLQRHQRSSCFLRLCLPAASEDVLTGGIKLVAPTKSTELSANRKCALSSALFRRVKVPLALK